MLIKRKLALLSIIFILGVLLFVASRSNPIPVGDAEDYWEFACGVELENFDGYFPYAYWTGIFPKFDGWYFYYYQEHHGRHVYKVSKKALAKCVLEVFSLLNKKITNTVQNHAREDILVKKNTNRMTCLEIMVTVKQQSSGFIDKVSTIRGNELREGLRKNEMDNFIRQWKRAQRYWLSVLFEAIFLCFWWLFTFHSGVFGKFNRNISTRIALSPILLFLPHYLGYAPYLFTFGPSGGILYPLFAMLFALPFAWIPYNPIEIEILKILPQPLTYVSQAPASPMALSYGANISPTILFIFAVIVLLSGKMWKKYRNEVKN